MKIKQANKKNKIIIIVTVIASCIATLLIILSFFLKNDHPPVSIEQNQSSEETAKKEEAQKNETTSDKKVTEKTIPTNTDIPEKPVENPDHIYTVSMISSIDIENGSVFIRGGINNLSSDSGECIAEMTHQDGTVVSKTTNLLPGPQSSSCKTIEIPIKELKTGQWKMKLKYKNQNTTGETDAKKFTIQQ